MNYLLSIILFLPAAGALRPIRHIMNNAIEFDCEPSASTIEIKHVGTDRMLPSKHGLARHSAAKPAP